MMRKGIVLKKPKLVAVVVTTVHKGVFFGYADVAAARSPVQDIRLERARMCVHWSADVKGMPGLASGGPTKTCKIGPAVPSAVLKDVTAIFECSKEAIEAWEQGPWA